MSFEIKIQTMLDAIEPVGEGWINAAIVTLNGKKMPMGNLGKLVPLTAQVVSIFQDMLLSPKGKSVYTLIADHGVAKHLTLSTGRKFKPEDSYAILDELFHGKLPVNAITRQNGNHIKVVNAGIQADASEWRKLINKPAGKVTGDITRAKAMSMDEVWSSIGYGIELLERDVDRGTDLVGLGHVGIGAQIPAAALLTHCLGSEFVPLLPEAEQALVLAAIKRANLPDAATFPEILSSLGGFDIGLAAGICISAAYYGRPLVLDGLVAMAGATVAIGLCETVADYLFFAGESADALGDCAARQNIMHLPVYSLGTQDGAAACLGIHALETGLSMLRRLPDNVDDADRTDD